MIPRAGTVVFSLSRFRAKSFLLSFLSKCIGAIVSGGPSFDLVILGGSLHIFIFGFSESSCVRFCTLGDSFLKSCKRPGRDSVISLSNDDTQMYPSMTSRTERG